MISKPMVIGFAGRIASGKSSIATAAAESLGTKVISFGDFCRDVAEYMGLNRDDREVLQEIGGLLVKHPREFCAKILAKAEYQAGQTLIIDGIRHREIIEELKIQVAPAPVLLILVEADDSTIENRLYNEGNSKIEIGRLERDPTEAQLISVLPILADIKIRSDELRSPEDALRKILHLLEKHQSAVPVDSKAGTVTIPLRELEQLKNTTEQAVDDVRIHEELMLTQGIMRLAEQSKAFDWLHDEEDNYTLDDLKVRYK